MADFNSIFSLIGIALCAIVFLQMGMSVANSLGLLFYNGRKFETSQNLLREEIKASVKQKSSKSEPNTWNGYRPFVVSKIVKEAATTSSVYLEPEDRKDIPTFRPGQHLTFRLNIPNQNKPVIRCYSLSDGPNKAHYRISVKQSLPPRGTDHPPGIVSTFVNQGLAVGDVIEVKSPSGHFYLNEDNDCPIVLLAGGVGITPMISMIDRLINTGSKRTVILVYGVNDGSDQPFKDYLKSVTSAYANIHCVSCYSRPLESDVKGKDYQVQGYASVDLLKQILPNNQCEYYICGPPPFMNSLYEGLLAWQVPETKVFFEAFGPASIKRKKASKPTKDSEETVGASVTFASSQKTVAWNNEVESLLDLADENEIICDSGCRAGSCGTCEVELISGKVKYPEGQGDDCPSGKCLLCIARPDGPVELGA